MSRIEQLASQQGAKGQQLNIDLAEDLVASHDLAGIQEIVAGLTAKQKIANDCIKVLYEVGARQPELIADNVQVFLNGLTSKNNRLVWGSMTALAEIVNLRTAEIFAQVDLITAVLETGSVIAIDNAVTVLAELCAANSDDAVKLWPILLTHLTTCRSKEVPQHAERTLPAVTPANQPEFVATLQQRWSELTAAQQKRVRKMLNAL
ncbi:hypothetical protein [Lapidilactobacillus bayanensis]|uniref:hypothetical protein n=1 Tax=Lapidilactobacillus bayanensis TaxID=2485998 RepID=UPI000F7B89D4|nr:hypothetical protein [Lapidilactobacillus bayanensis]